MMTKKSALEKTCRPEPQTMAVILSDRRESKDLLWHFGTIFSTLLFSSSPHSSGAQQIGTTAATRSRLHALRQSAARHRSRRRQRQGRPPIPASPQGLYVTKMRPQTFASASTRPNRPVHALPAPSPARKTYGSTRSSPTPRSPLNRWITSAIRIAACSLSTSTCPHGPADQLRALSAARSSSARR